MDKWLDQLNIIEKIKFEKLKADGRMKLIEDEHGRKILWIKKGPQRPSRKYYDLKIIMGIRMDGTGVKCAECSNPATEAHPMNGDHKQYDPKRWVVLCRPHHRMRHFPTIFRFVPKGGNMQRQYPRIVAMTHKETLTVEDRQYLEGKPWGEVYLRAWFPSVAIPSTSSDNPVDDEEMVDENDL